ERPSPGEARKLMLALGLLREPVLVVLDEPTNDLDIETVELLEERLLEFDGTLLIVSHDRSFLNNVVTSTLALEGDGVITESVGGCEEWLKRYEASKAPMPKQAAPPQNKAANPQPDKARKLSNKEREALKKLPEKIEILEQEYAELGERMASSAYYKDNNNDPAVDASRLEALETEILEAYEQLEKLESLTPTFPPIPHPT
ncbi:MAG: ABC transporter ATP-binding protein, partial [Opitutales bacterium]